MSRHRSIFALAAGVSSITACANTLPLETRPPATEVLAFVEAEGVPRVRRIEVLLDVRAERAQVFRITYGDSVRVIGACEAGCGYTFPTAIGLQLGSHIGWLAAADTALDSHFDVVASDAYFFSEDFFGRLERVDVTLFQQAFKVRLAADVDTPEHVLWRLVQGLSSWISPSLVDVLLDNPNVAGNEAMLRHIADLPVFQGDAYREARQRSARMLATP